MKSGKIYVLCDIRQRDLIGYDVDYIPVDKCGIVEDSALENALCESTQLVSVMLANNEIGTIQPVMKAITEALAAKGFTVV